MCRMETTGQSGLTGEQKLERTNLAAEQMTREISQARLPAEIPDSGEGERCSSIKRIPVEIDVSVPIRRFRVRDVLALKQGQVIATPWLEGEDMPLAAHGTQLAWSEIEVIDQKLAVRITRLA